MSDLKGMTQAEIKECGDALSKLGSGATSMEEVANRIVSHLYDNLGDKQTGGKACALVRFYKTHPYGDLDATLQGFANGILGTKPESGAMNCLTLLGTIGDQPDWNSRAKSNGHRAIPLASAEFVGQIPMISRLINQFGLDMGSVLRPDPMLIGDLSEKTYNTFYVPEAVGSPYIPAQSEFVIPYGIKSVLGFGGVLSSGVLFVVIMFSKVAIPQETADNFRSLAPSVKNAVEPLAGTAVFA